jgi:lipopolysaccharide transport protein LptA
MKDFGKHVKKFSFKINALQFFLLFFLISPVFALKSDQNQPLNINADSAFCQRKDETNFCVYSGKVIFAQGTSLLKAPKVTVYKKYDKINKVEALGLDSLAHYQVELDESHKLVVAKAKIITLYPDKNLMVLSGDGEIVEDNNKFNGPYLEYVFK